MYYEGKIKKATVSDKHVLGFFGEYYFMSNFYPCPNGVTVMGPDGCMHTFPTSEHAYMIFKTKDIREWNEMAALPSAYEARQYGRKSVTLRKDWDEVRISAMQYVLYQKFSQNQCLLRKLLDTGNKYLEETNDWGDQFWGVTVNDRKGENHLGRALMTARSLFSIVESVSIESFV